MNKRLVAIGLLDFVNVLGFAVFIPVFPFIVKQYGGTALTYGLLLASYPLFQFLAAPLFGTLSDVYGRRPILILSQAGTVVSWLIFGLAYFVPDIQIGAFPLALIIILLSRVVDGITGGNTSVANAYIADISPPHEKTKIFGIFGTIGGLGLVVGPLIGGATHTIGIGYLGPVFFSFLLSLLSLVALYFYLPETLPKKERQKNLALNLREELNIFAKIGNLKSPFLKKMFFFRLYFFLAFSSYTSIVVLLVIDRFDLTANQLGVLFLLSGIFFILNVAVVSKLISAKFGQINAYYFGHLCMMIGLLGTVFASNIVIFMLVAYILNVGYAISFPLFRTIITDYVAHAKHGTVIGIDESILAGASAVAPIAASFLYDYIGAWTYGVFSVLLLVPHIVLYARTRRVFVRIPT